MLKPFIRRDYESRPLKMRLLEEIKAYPHRYDKEWKHITSFKMISKTHLKEQIAWVSSFFYLLLWGMLPYIIDFFFHYGIKNNLLEHY